MKYLLALILFHKHNIHMLHWNMYGQNFIGDHRFFAELYQHMEDDIDTVAEMLIQEGGMPVSYQDALALLNSDSIDHTVVESSKHYTTEESYVLASKIFTEINDAFDACASDDNIHHTHISQLESLQEWYLLNGKFLIARRLASFGEGVGTSESSD